MAKIIIVIEDNEKENGNLDINVEFDPILKPKDIEDATPAQILALTFLSECEGH